MGCSRQWPTPFHRFPQDNPILTSGSIRPDRIALLKPLHLTLIISKALTSGMDNDSAGSEAEQTLQNGASGSDHAEDPAPDVLHRGDDADLFGDGSEAGEDG